jgi:hypothetical protein
MITDQNPKRFLKDVRSRLRRADVAVRLSCGLAPFREVVSGLKSETELSVHALELAMPCRT